MRWIKDNRGTAAGLGALLVVTIVLVVLALRPVQVPASTGPAFTPSPSGSAEPVTEEPSEEQSEETSTAEPSPEESDPPEEPVEPVPTARLLTAASAERAWRATVGACDDLSTLEVTDDGGDSWEFVDPGLTPIVRVKALDEGTMFAIGGAGECAASFGITDSAGAQWESADDELGGSWYAEPEDRNVVHGPSGAGEPCSGDVVDLAGLDGSTATVLCTDSEVLETSDGGGSWSSIGNLTGAVGVAPQLDTEADFQGFLIASIEPDCAGVAIRAMDTDGSGLDGSPVGCAQVDGASAGEVAVALNDEVAWVWAGDEVLVSQDAGATW